MICEVMESAPTSADGPAKKAEKKSGHETHTGPVANVQKLRETATRKRKPKQNQMRFFIGPYFFLFAQSSAVFFISAVSFSSLM